jgi:hypothetical protein
MAHNGTALRRSNAPLTSKDGSYPGLRPTVRIIAEYALRGQSREPVHDAAREALKSNGVPLLPVSKQSPAWRERAAHAIYEWMGPNVKYAYDPEGVEQVQEPTATIMLGQGDCDDMVSLGVAMLTAVGVPARIKVVRQNGSDVFNHIYAVYQGESAPQFEPFDPTLHRPEKGERASVGDGPDESLLAEAVEVPVTGAPGNLGPRTERALRQLPADAGVVPDSKLESETSESSPSQESAPSAMSSMKPYTPSGATTEAPYSKDTYKTQIRGGNQIGPSGPPSTAATGGQATAEDPFSTSDGDLTRQGRAPGSSKTISVASEEEVKVVSPQEYRDLIEQAVQTGQYTCTTSGRMVIRAPDGREILPGEEASSGSALAEAGISGWAVPTLLAGGVVALLASAGGGGVQ